MGLQSASIKLHCPFSMNVCVAWQIWYTGVKAYRPRVFRFKKKLFCYWNGLLLAWWLKLATKHFGYGSGFVTRMHTCQQTRDGRYFDIIAIHSTCDSDIAVFFEYRDHCNFVIIALSCVVTRKSIKTTSKNTVTYLATQLLALITSILHRFYNYVRV